MSAISKISPDGGTTQFDIKDANAQPKNLTTPISVKGETKSTVETCLEALAAGTDIYVEEHTLYLPTSASVSEGVLIIG